MFYTNGQQGGTIIPKLGSISAYQSAIEDNKKKLDDLTHQQFQLMLQNDTAGMDALEKQYKETEQAIDALKLGLGEVMGANVHGPSGNQLTGSGWFGRMMGLGEQEEEELRAPQIGKPLFAANDTMVHTAEMSGETQPIPTTEPDPSDPTSDFWDTHVRPDPFRPGDPNLNNAPLKPGTPGTETIQTTFPDVTDPTSNFWDTHERPDPFDPNDPNLINAPLKPGMKEPDYTQYVVEKDDGKDTGERRGVTDSGGGYADFFRGQREGVTDSGGGYADFFREQREKDETEGYKLPDYIKQKYDGDAGSIKYIKSTKMFDQVANDLIFYGQDDRIETKLKLNVTGTTEVEVSKEFAKDQYIEMCNSKDLEKDVGFLLYGIMFGIETGAISATAAAGVASSSAAEGIGTLTGIISSLASFGTEKALNKSTMNYDIDDMLGGTYKISRFTLDADWDVVGRGGGKHHIRTGYIIYGKPIVLKTDEVIENPFNAVFLDRF